jgi:diapolycopene oxygenase
MKIAVIGGGLGGMASALVLAKAGADVHIYEKNSMLGGKMQRIELGAYQFDFGPNTITMPHVFQEVLAATGVNPDDYLEFIPLAEHMQNVSAEGETLIFSTNKEAMKRQIATFSQRDADRYESFLEEITRIYELADRYFLRKTFFKKRDYVHPMLGAAILRVKPFQTFETFLKRYFEHPFILQCFLRYGTYIGSSPYKMPATFAMIAYLELVQGVYYVKGGTSTIAKAFERRLQELGVHIHLNSHVTDVYSFNYRIHSLDVNGEVDEHVQEEFHAVIVNGDVLTHKKMLKYGNVETKYPTTSALVALVGLNKRLPQLAHHNVFYSASYEEEFQQLFTEQYAQDSTVYICNSSITDETVSPNGDNLLVLINAPAYTKKNALSEAEAFSFIEKQLQRNGIDIEHAIVEKRIITPQHIQNEFLAYRGALYGQNSNSFKQAFLRPRNRHPIYKNLYFVGGTVHPGGGSPLVVLGGMEVAKRIIREQKKTPIN